ncbi:type II toxin-antitoxin system RelE/ParE family toxin [Raoultibacter phocaeensis]|uniref:type II toxin-antitoxin system RelE/ParE family toxin n=1 Tax=Raoultibacter phocaeensis TaxID=2479841 RepID=UPI0034E2975C
MIFLAVRLTMLDYVIGPAMRKDLKKIKSKDLAQIISAAIDSIREDPSCGTAKVGDLAGLVVYRFSHKGVSYRLGYYYSSERSAIVFSLFDTREDFYSRAKRVYDPKTLDASGSSVS